jgi:hypothetical protein
MLAKYPIYGMILNWIPYTHPAIAGFLVWWLLFTWYRKSPSGTVSVSLPKLQKDQIYYVYVVVLVMITVVSFLLLATD